MRIFYNKLNGEILDFVDDTTSVCQNALSDGVGFGSSASAVGYELNISELDDLVQLITTRVIDGQKVTQDYVAILRTGTLEQKVNALIEILLGREEQ
jgi:hypothetical protein